MAEYRTPGVYTHEVGNLPTSVVSVGSAIPAFVGRTAVQPGTGSGTRVVVQKIQNLLDYQASFGGPGNDVTLSATAPYAQLAQPVNRMYYSLVHYFLNGGGPCYIASVGLYTDPGSVRDAAIAGIAALDLEDEPTLYLFTDAMADLDYKAVIEQACLSCEQLGDRIFLADVPDPTVASPVVRQASLLDASLGAAYTPALVTSISPVVADSAIIAFATTPATTNAPAVVDYGLVNNIKAALAGLRVTLPPTPAVAGAIVTNDARKGAWSAPANIPLLAVDRVAFHITDEQQAGLNVDVVAGRSINAVRTFTGQGTLVWGARTLDGNSAEWRYVNVRRYSLTIQESIRKAIAAYVFEPNTPRTWQAVISLVDAYLASQWQDGGLMGASAADAYSVQCGLGSTMTSQDIAEGIMRVSVAVALVRPAEFIILTFEQQLPIA